MNLPWIALKLYRE